jgi:hypothetical protein
MITQEQQRQGTELIKTLIEKAWESAAFKDQLVNNPVGTIESITGNKITGNHSFVVEDQTDSSLIYFNIPRKVELDNFELTDEQLEVVAGGEIAVGALVVGSFLAGVSIGIALAVIN